MAASALRSLAAATLAAAAAAAGPCPGGACAAGGDDVSMLQARPEAEPRKSMWKAHRAGTADPEEDPTLMILGVAMNFEKAAGYAGAAEVFGKVTVSAFKGPNLANSGTQLCYDLLDVDPSCRRGPASGGKSCGIELHTGTCASMGALLWSQEERAKDPWHCVGYVAEEQKYEDIEDIDEPSAQTLAEGRAARSGSLTTGFAKGRVSVYTGLAPDAIRDAVVVVRDHYGQRMACAPVSTKGEGVTSTSTPTTTPELVPPAALVAQGSSHLRPLRATNFVKYPGWSGKTVWGEILIFERMGKTLASTGQLLTWDLEEVDNECAKGPKADVANSCGIHVEDGSCSSLPTSGDMWDPEAVERNPWGCVAYTSLWTQRTPKAAGRSITAYTGLGSQELIGKAVVVYSAAGVPMSCAEVLFE